MKIGITFDPSRYEAKEDLIARLETLKKQGYETIDDQEFITTANRIYALSDEEFEKTLLDFKATCGKVGLAIHQLHGPWDSTQAYATEEAREFQYRAMVRVLEGCKILGCRYMAIHNVMPTGVVDEDPAAAFALNLAFFSRLAKEAERLGVVVCLENMPFLGQGVASPDKMLGLIKAVNSPNVRMCLDTGHAVIHGVTPADAVRRIGKDYLAILHVHDNDGAHDYHWTLGSGVIDWEDFGAALAEIGFEGSVSLETSVHRDGLSDEEFAAAEQALADAALRIAGRA